MDWDVSVWRVWLSCSNWNKLKPVKHYYATKKTKQGSINRKQQKQKRIFQIKLLKFGQNANEVSVQEVKHLQDEGFGCGNFYIFPQVRTRVWQTS